MSSPEYKRIWRLNNKEKVLSYRKKYYLNSKLKFPRCLDCNGFLSRKNAIRCHSCDTNFRMKIKENHPMFGHKHSLWTRLLIKNNTPKPIFSEETRNKISVSNKGKTLGRTHSNESRKKISDFRKGKFLGILNPFWKGGRRELKILIRELPEYKEWRNYIFKRDKFECIKCGFRGKLNVDHIVPFRKILEDFLNEYSMFSVIDDKFTLIKLSLIYKPFWDTFNGRTLCIPCHRKTNTYGSSKFKVLNDEVRFPDGKFKSFMVSTT
ncbi:MAG: NUMOD3 domain-containing DNA-binding protein [Nanoarchaeota archaeon]